VFNNVIYLPCILICVIGWSFFYLLLVVPLFFGDKRDVKWWPQQLSAIQQYLSLSNADQQELK